MFGEEMKDPHQRNQTTISEQNRNSLSFPAHPPMLILPALRALYFVGHSTEKHYTSFLLECRKRSRVKITKCVGFCLVYWGG